MQSREFKELLFRESFCLPCYLSACRVHGMGKGGYGGRDDMNVDSWESHSLPIWGNTWTSPYKKVLLAEIVAEKLNKPDSRSGGNNSCHVGLQQTKRGEKQVGWLSVCLALCRTVRPQNPTTHTHDQCAEKCTSRASSDAFWKSPASELFRGFLTEVSQQR